MFQTNKDPDSIGAYIVSHYAELSKCRSKQDVENFVRQGINSTNKSYVEGTVIPQIRVQRNWQRAVDYVGRNLVLAGYNMRAD